MLYFCGILGANAVTEDDWMASDIAVAAAIVDDPATAIQISHLLRLAASVAAPATATSRSATLGQIS
jgi:hypothetical protein